MSSYCGKIFVDEAQDIDDDTLAIIQTLNDAGIPIELVGDPKQDLRGHESFRKLLNRYGADISYISICHRCPQKHLRMSNTLVPDEEKQTSEKEDGIVNFVFEGDIRTSEFIKAGNFDLVYISARNKRFETHPRKGSSNYFESLNHEISDVVKRRNPKASKYLIAKSSYYLTHCIITDIDGGDEPQNVMWKYFAGTLNGQQYTKIISAARKPAKETAAIPIVSTIDGIKGREGNNCLFILTADLAPYLFGENTSNNKTKNKLYVALTRSLYRLTILITAEVQKGYGSQYIQNYFTKLVSIG